MSAPLPLEEAQARLLALAPSLPLETVPIEAATGRWLGQPLAARRTQPAAALSAMDGFALRGADLPGPWRVIGESAAGRPFAGRVGTGEAVRIATGALVPDGADAVLLQEDCAREGDALRLTGDLPSPPGRHIRAAGIDFVAGQPLLEAGVRLGPAQLALAIAAGHAEVTVRRPPRVAVIDGGDELAAPGAADSAHRLPASNGPMLAAMAQALGAEVVRIGPVPDRLDALIAAFGRAESVDVVVTSGGASVGDHDLVRPALEAAGAAIDFWKVAIKPGKPLLVARKASQLVLGLPGNPVSSFVTGFLFLLPLLRASLGSAEPLPRPFRAPLAMPMARGGRRLEFLRARWSGDALALEPVQDSSALLPLARAEALVRREANAPAAAIGEIVTAYRLDSGGIA